jgi:hypothetical protein
LSSIKCTVGKKKINPNIPRMLETVALSASSVKCFFWRTVLLTQLAPRQLAETRWNYFSSQATEEKGARQIIFSGWRAAGSANVKRLQSILDVNGQNKRNANRRSEVA